MKSIKILIPAIMAIALCCPHHAAAQDDMGDVIYLKNGDTLRGRIRLIYPGEGFQIVTQYREKVKVYADDTLRITREVLPYYERERKYFFEFDGNLGMQQGLVLINGYKSGRYGYLGLGLGILYDPRAHQDGFGGSYFPVFIHYSGDILKKKVTPFYALEAGYNVAIHPSVNAIQFGASEMSAPGKNTDHGGVMGGVGFGGRFHTILRVNFTLAIFCDMEYMSYQYKGYNPSTYSYLIGQGYRGGYSGPLISETFRMFYPVPAVRLGIGF